MGLGFRTVGIPSEEDLDYDERASWSYSGFNRFREKIVRELGWAASLEDFWADPRPYRGYPLYPFLMHSDCDGVLTPEECATIAPALRAVVKDWAADGYPHGYDRQQALLLAAHMELCAELGLELGFC